MSNPWQMTDSEAMQRRHSSAPGDVDPAPAEVEPSTQQPTTRGFPQWLPRAEPAAAPPNTVAPEPAPATPEPTALAPAPPSPAPPQFRAPASPAPQPAASDQPAPPVSQLRPAAEPSPQPAPPQASPAPVVTPPAAVPPPAAAKPPVPQMPPAPRTTQLVVTLPDIDPTPVRPPQNAPKPDPRADRAGAYNMRADSRMVRDPDRGASGWWRRMSQRLGGDQSMPAEQALAQVKKTLSRPMVIAFLNHDGGSAKTTVAAATGQQLATHRRDRIIALDAADAVGGLTQRLPVDNESTIRTFLNNRGTIRKWTDARQHTSQGRTGLELLTSGNSIADEDLLTGSDYREVIRILTAHDTYNLVLVDCDAGVTGELKDEVLRTADVLVIPLAGRDGVAGGVTVANRLKYLAAKYPAEADHFEDLLANAIVVISHINRTSALKDKEVERRFINIGVRSVHVIPFDPLLQDGMKVDLSTMARKTESSYLTVTAEIVRALTRINDDRAGR